jgi:hypothetical protein
VIIVRLGMATGTQEQRPVADRRWKLIEPLIPAPAAARGIPPLKDKIKRQALSNEGSVA